MGFKDYKREERKQIKPGNHRCVIVDAEQTESQSGNEMIIVTVRPSGSDIEIKKYIVDGPYFNRNMTELFDAFPEIGEGNFNLLTWVGCEGAAKFVLDENDYLKVRRFLRPDEAENLPPFEGDKPEKQTVTHMTPVDDNDDLPF